MEMGAGDIAFKSNFASINEETGIVVRRRVDRSFEEEGEVLSGALDGLGVEVGGRGYKVSCRYATEHRCGVVVRGEGLCDEVEGTDPLKDGLGLRESRGCEEECDRDVECGEQSEDAVERRERREHTARVGIGISNSNDRALSLCRSVALSLSHCPTLNIHSRWSTWCRMRCETYCVTIR